MRVTATDGYFNHECEFDECQKNFCERHRLLWRFCDTAVMGIEGDRDVINGTRVIWEHGDCPKCEKETQAKEAEKMQKEWELRMARNLP